jgi:hypothetical protein
MTQDEIIELTKEVYGTQATEQEILFAKLVAEKATAKERERIKEEKQRCYVARGQA